MSVPDTVAVTVPSFPAGTFHTYVHVALDTAVIDTLVTRLPILILGAVAIFSLNVAVRVTLSVLFTILSESVSVRITVGDVLSSLPKEPTKIPLPYVEATTLLLYSEVPLNSKSLTLTSVMPLFDCSQLGEESLKLSVCQTPRSVPIITSFGLKGLY